MLHMPLTDYHPLSTKQQPYKRAHLFSTNTEEFPGQVRATALGRTGKEKEKLT